MTTAGLLIDAGVGFVNGGWIGAVFLGLTGAAVGLGIAAAGWAGLALLLGG